MNINFDKEKHEYRVDGKVVPCVSNIMKVATCLYYTEDIPSEIIELACKKGNEVHKAIEDFLLFDEYDISESYKPIFEQFIKWYEDYQPEILKIEYQMCNGEYAGTCDLICKIDNKIIGIDYKTSNKIHTKLVAIQEAGYDELLRNNKIKVDDWYVLHLNRKKYEFKKIEIREDIWNKCKDIYFYMNGDVDEC